MNDKHPRSASGEKAHVETYQLPRWDARGQPVKAPTAHKKPQQPEAEDVSVESLSPPTASDIRQIHEDAYNEGFESGFEQGMKQGQATGQAEGYKTGYDSGEQEGRSAGHKAGQMAAEKEESSRISKELAPLAKLLADIKQILPEQRRDLEAGMVALASRIARNVIDAELTLNPDHISELIHAAVQALPNADERFTLEINPDDAQYVDKVAEPHWNVVPTPAVSRGGCVIRTRFSYVDYSLEHRYRQQVSNLLAHVGLSEQLTELEKPWPLPPSQIDAGSNSDDAESTSDIENPGDAETVAREEVSGFGSSETMREDAESDALPDALPDAGPSDKIEEDDLRARDVEGADLAATEGFSEAASEADETTGQDIGNSASLTEESEEGVNGADEKPDEDNADTPDVTGQEGDDER